MIPVNRLLPETLPDTVPSTVDFATSQSSTDIYNPLTFVETVTITAQQATINPLTTGSYHAENHSGFILVNERTHNTSFSYVFD